MNKIISAIVTPTWNNAEYTIRCFDSIQKNTKEYKIIWVDNGSTKEDRQKVKQFLDKSGTPYELIQNEENLGFVKATNQGMKRAMELGADYIVLQNNDTEVYASWLDRMIEVSESDEKIGLVGPITSPCVSWQSIVNLKKNHSEFSDLPEYKNNPKEYAQIIADKYNGKIFEVIDYLAFFSTLIKKQVIEKNGFLSEEFGVGFGEDNDYCVRAMEAGWRVVVAEDVFVFHNHRTTFKAIYSEKKIDEMLVKNGGIYKKKHENFLKQGKASDNSNEQESENRCPYCGMKTVDNIHIVNCKKTSPLISVIIPSRVGEEIISTKTLATQTYENMEVIVEYDEKGEGASATRNRGAKKAKGKYLFFCDNDLILSQTCLSDLYLALRADAQAKWAFGKFIIDGRVVNEGKQLSLPQKKRTLEWIAYFYCMSTMSLIDASIEPVFNEEMRRFNDWDLWLTLAEKGHKPVFCDKILFTTENRKGGITIANQKDIEKWTKKLIKNHNIEITFLDIENVVRLEIFSKIIQEKDQEILQKERELYAIRTSLRWKIPNYFFKIYKIRIKKFVPRSVFKLKDFLVLVYYKILLAAKKLNLKKIKNSIFQSDPIITIGIASYNHSEYLEQCIQSALRQDYEKYNILIVDDNSSDPRNREILKNYESNDKITIIYKEKNEGISASLNEQVVNAKGEWVAFMDCDDYLPVNALSQMAKHIKSYPGKKLIFSNRIEVDENNKILQKVWFGNRTYNKNIFHELMKGMVSSHLKLIHRDAFLKVGLFDDRFGGTHDYDMYLKVAFYMPEAFGHIDEYLYYHRIHSSQNTVVESDKHKRNVELMRKEFRFREQIYGGNFDKLVSIIILSFNRGERLKKTIDKIISHTKNIKKEIIIWDNGSTDQKTINILNHLKKKQDIFVNFSKENLRCSGGRREAAKLAKGEFLYFLDNDIEIELGAIEELIIRMYEDENIAGVCSKVIFPNEKIQFNGGRYVKKENTIIFDLIDSKKNRTKLSSMEKYDCDWIPGGATLFKKKIFDSVEHDTGYINAFEDNDFSLQITEKLKMKVVNCPTSCVVHYHLNFEHFLDAGTKKYKEIRRDDSAAFINSWVRFYKKWGLIIEDDFILGIADLKDKNREEIIRYLQTHNLK